MAPMLLLLCHVRNGHLSNNPYVQVLSGLTSPHLVTGNTGQRVTQTCNCAATIEQRESTGLWSIAKKGEGRRLINQGVSACHELAFFMLFSPYFS